MNKSSKQTKIIPIIGIIILLIVLILVQDLLSNNLPIKAADITVDWESDTCTAVDKNQLSNDIKQSMCERLTSCFWQSGTPGHCLINERGNYPALIVDLVQLVGGDYQVKNTKAITKDFAVKPALGEGYIVAVRTANKDYFQTFSPYETMITEDFTDQGIKLTDYSETLRTALMVEVGTGREFLVDPDRFKIIIKPCNSYDNNFDNDCSLANALFIDEQQKKITCGSGNSSDGSCCQCNNGKGVDVTAIIQEQCSGSLLYCQFNYGSAAFADYGGNCQSNCSKLTTINYSCYNNQIETLELVQKGSNEQGTIFCFGGKIKIHRATFGGPKE